MLVYNLVSRYSHRSGRLGRWEGHYVKSFVYSPDHFLFLSPILVHSPHCLLFSLPIKANLPHCLQLHLQPTVWFLLLLRSIWLLLLLLLFLLLKKRYFSSNHSFHWSHLICHLILFIHNYHFIPLIISILFLSYSSYSSYLLM